MSNNVASLKCNKRAYIASAELFPSSAINLKEKEKCICQ